MHLYHPVATYLSTRTKERHAARFFYWLKFFGGGNVQNKRVFTLNEIESLPLPFTKYEIETYLLLLKKISWITEDQEGRMFLQGRKFFFGRYCAGKICRAGDITRDSVATKEAWNALVQSNMITDCGQSLKRTTSKEQRDDLSLCVHADNKDRPDEVLLSLKVIMQRTGMSKTAASRARTLAGKTHLKVTQNFTPATVSDRLQISSSPFRQLGDNGKQLAMSRADFAQFKDHYGSHFVLRGGLVFEQWPSSVTMLPSKRVTISWRSKKHSTGVVRKSAENFKN